MVGLGLRKPPSRKGTPYITLQEKSTMGLMGLIEIGSMAGVPKDLLDQINRLEELFTVPQEKLKQITEHFKAELTKGIAPLMLAYIH
jgi:hexokinase